MEHLYRVAFGAQGAASAWVAGLQVVGSCVLHSREACLRPPCSALLPRRSAPAARLPPLQLEVLGMGWCKVGNGDGVKAVADMLMYNQTIRRLDLRGNGLGNDGERRRRKPGCGPEPLFPPAQSL